METGRKANKIITANEGTGLSNSSTPNSKVVMPPEVRASTAGNIEYAGEDESKTVVSGAGGGDYAGSPGSTPHRWGHTSPSGSRIEVNDSGGSERIEMVHHSGAAVTIDPDGGVYIVSTSARGAGVGAPFGDFYVSAAGDIIIKGGASVTVDTPGDMVLNVGGTLAISAGAIKVITKNMDETIDGSASRSVTNDQSVVIGGIDRKTVAGDSRDQISGQKILDVAGACTTRVDGNATTSVGGNHSIAVTGDSSLSAEGDNNIYGGGNTNVTGQGEATVFSGGAVKLTGSAINASPKVDRAEWADESGQANQAVVLGGSTNTAPSESAGSAAEAGEVAEAQTAEANDIVDTLTSARKFPEYPGNGARESADLTGLGMISHDTTPQAEDVFNEYSGQNTGNWNPSISGGSYDTLPSDPVNRADGITSIDPGISAPARHNNNVKISKYFTLGSLVNAKHSHPIPAGKWESVVKNHVLLASNVLDPIKQKFPDIVITSAYRGNSSNHATGEAVDIVVESRSLTAHAEIARFARDNLPCTQVFLERNTSGRTHVHLRVAQPGNSSAPTVLTCADPKCQSSTSGIVVEYLQRKAIV